MIDAYKIGVSIAMTNGVSQVLSVIQKDVIGLNKHVDLLQSSFGRLHMAAIGAGFVVAGGAMLKGFEALVKAGEDLAQQKSAMLQAGMTQADVAQATAKAWQVTHDVIGSGITENLKLITDLKNTVGSLPEAMDMAPAMARVNAVLSNNTGKPAGEAGYEFFKFLENRGALTDPQTGQISMERLAQQARQFEAVIAATNGRVDPHKLFMFQGQAGAAGMQLSDQGMLGIIPLLQIMSGDKVGTMLASAGQQLLGGVQISHTTVDALEKVHLLDPRRVHEQRGGRFKVEPGALTNSDLFRTDFAQWTWDTLAPNLRAAGYDTTSKQIAWLQSSGLRSTVIRLLTEYVRNQAPFQKDIGNVQQASGVDQYDVMKNTSPTAAINDFHAAWDGLMHALGEPAVKIGTDLLKEATPVLKDAFLWASQHPGAVGDLEKFGLAVGGVLTVAGSAAVAGAGIAALGVLAGGPTGLLALAGGIAALAPAVEQAFGRITHALPTWMQQQPDPRTGKTVLQQLHDQHGVDWGAMRYLFGWQPPAPGTEGYPNGMPHAGPAFGPSYTSPDQMPPIRKQSYVPPPADNRPQVIHVTLRADGRSLAELVTDIQARELARPNAGTSRFDGRVIPSFASNLVSA